MLVKLTVSGQAFDPDSFVGKHDMETSTVWMRGDPMIVKGRVHSDAGFISPIGECESLAPLLDEVTAFIEDHTAALEELQGKNVKAAVDFGFGVGSDSAFVRSLLFPPRFVQALASHDLSLEVTAYPCACEGNSLEGSA